MYLGNISTNKFIYTSTIGKYGVANFNTGKTDSIINIVTGEMQQVSSEDKNSNYFKSVGENVVFTIKTAGNTCSWFATE